MKILRLTIQNLNSLRLDQPAVIDFSVAPLEESGIFAITGDTGAGKTTILDGLTLGLYGRVHRNKEVKEVLSYGAAFCLAEVEFETTAGVFRAKWGLWRANNRLDGKLQAPKREFAQKNLKTGEFDVIAEKIKEVDQAVEEASGLDYDRFTRSVLLSQGDFAAFLKADARDRSDLLERITGTELYSQLSVAAFEKYKLEQLALDTLQKEKEGLQLLDPSLLETLQTGLALKEKESAIVKKELDEQRKRIQQLNQKIALETQLDTLKRKQSGLLAQEATHAADFDRLALHQKAQPFQTQLVTLDNEEALYQQTEAEIAQLERQIQELNEAQIQSQEKYLGEQQLLTEWQSNYPLEKANIEKAKAIDIQLAERQGPLQKQQQECAQALRNVSQWEEQLAAIHELQQVEEKTLVELQAWLAEHDHLKGLQGQLPLINAKRTELRELMRLQLQLEKEAKTLLAEQQSLLAQAAILQKRIESEKTQLQQLIVAFEEGSPSTIPKSRSALLALLQDEIEQLNNQQVILQQLFQLNEEYQHLLEELAGFEEELDHLRSEEMVIHKKLMSSVEVLDWTRADLEYKQHVYDLEQMHANYEKDRQQLQEGMPCPLCGATHHPEKERKGNEKFVDKAKSDLDSVKGRYEVIYQEHKNLLKQQDALELRIEQLAGNELKEVSGQVAKQFQRILAYEEKLAKVGPLISDGAFKLTRTSLLQLKMEESAAKIADMKSARTELLKLQSTIEQLEKTLIGQEETQKEGQHKINILAEKIRAVQEQLADYKKRFDDMVEGLNETIAPYNRQFDLAKAAQLFEELELLNQDFLAKTAQAQSLDNGIEKRQLQQVQIENRLQENKAILVGLEAEIDRIQKEISVIQAERTAVLGTQNPKELEEQLEQKLSNQTEKVNKLQQALTQLDTQLKSYEQQLIEKRISLSERHSKISQATISLQASIQAQHFMDLSACRAALLSDPEFQRIQTLKKALEGEQLALGQSLKDTQAELERLLKQDLPSAPIETLQAILEEQEEAFQLLQQEIGALRERIQQHFKQEQKALVLLKTMEDQQREVIRWAKLNDLIGQADGKKFRIFAQGLTLNKLIFLANQHLQQLNGRYLIKKSETEDLELEIVDTYQADNARSMNTLSGGESFLVSLAMALALSDLAGRSAQIQSLFIDEGFGTLDDNSLDLAITTLENLQANGKTIGVISHVKALKERISTQIKLVKKGSGFSHLEVTAQG